MNDMRLIDADELLEVLNKKREEFETEVWIPNWWAIFNAIAKQPTVPAGDYNKGLEDAWELAKKLWLPTFNGGMACEELEVIFDCAYNNISKKFTPQEALAKLEAYEKENELKVGDVVELADGTKAVVMDRFDDEIFALFNENGCVENLNIKSDFKKTNKHIDITSVLEQLRGE